MLFLLVWALCGVCRWWLYLDLCVQAHSQGPIWLVGVCERTDPGCRFHFFVMVSWTIISFSRASISSLASMATLHLVHCTGWMLSLSVMLNGPGILPILSKESGNICFRSCMMLTVIWSCNGGKEMELPWKRCMDDLWSCKGQTAIFLDMFSGCWAYFLMAWLHCLLFCVLTP